MGYCATHKVNYIYNGCYQCKSDRELIESQAKEIEGLQDLAIWMTGCGYDFTQHEYYMKNRYRALHNQTREGSRMGEFMDEMNARNDKDYLTEEDKKAHAKLPKCVFEFMGIPKPPKTKER